MNKETIEAMQLQLDQFKTKATEETQIAIKALEEKLNNLSKEDKEATAKELKALKSDLADINEFVNQAKEDKSKGAKTQDSPTKALRDAIEENKEALKSLKTNPSGAIGFEVKAAAVMMTSTHLTGDIVRAENLGYEAPMSYKPSVFDVLRKSPTNAAVINYIEKVNIEGTAKMTAEGAAKPDRDFELIAREVKVKKVAVVEKASKEMLDDVDSFYDFMTDDMREAVYDELKVQALEGDGTGENLTGLMTIAKPFVSGTKKVADANMFDVIRVAAAQILRAGGRPTHFAVSIEDAVDFDLQKDKNGNYILPPFSTSTGTNIKGVTLVEDVNMKQDEFLVWDNNRARIRFREELGITNGWENDDFRKNLSMFICETRLVLIVKEQYKAAFVKGKFSEAIAALTPAPVEGLQAKGATK